jgi:hypothetical protein
MSQPSMVRGVAAQRGERQSRLPSHAVPLQGRNYTAVPRSLAPLPLE